MDLDIINYYQDLSQKETNESFTDTMRSILTNII